MAEGEREFRIKITGDSGALVRASQEAANALKETEGSVVTASQAHVAAAGRMAAAAEGAEIPHRKLLFALRQISPAAAEAGHALMVGFSNPLLLSLIAVGALIETIKKVHDNFNEVKALLEGGIDLKGFTSVEMALKEGWVTAFREAGKAADEFKEKLSRLEKEPDSAKQKADDEIADIKKKAEAQTKLNEAEEKRDLAKVAAQVKGGALSQAEGAAQSEAIRAHYAQGRIDISGKAAEAEIDARVNERTEWTQKLYEKKAAAGSAEKFDQDAQAAVAAKKDELEVTKKFVEEQKKQLDEAVKKGLPVGMTAGRWESDLDLKRAQIKEAEDKEERLKATGIPDAERTALRTKLDREQAEKAVEESVKRGKELDREIPRMRSDLTRSDQNRVAVSNADIAAKGYEAEGALAGSKEGKLFAAAGESMWLAQHGKTLSGGQQHQLAAAEKLLEQHAISGESTVQLLASLHNKQDRLNKKIAELAAKVQQSHIR
jgi:hypothetical protein